MYKIYLENGTKSKNQEVKLKPIQQMTEIMIDLVRDFAVYESILYTPHANTLKCHFAASFSMNLDFESCDDILQKYTK